VAVIAAAVAFGLSFTQRALSTPARSLRRQVSSVNGELSLKSGEIRQLQLNDLLRPFERALKALTWSMLGLAVVFLAARLG
jgi:hypothetical protein